MRYEKIIKATFISRPNRFLAKVNIEGNEVTVHVKNTGRLRELLIPGAEVILADGHNPARKTKYDLIAVRKDGFWVNIDSQAPNLAVKEWLEKRLLSKEDFVRSEKTFGNSRFDIYLESQGRKAFMEVKGVTLEVDGKALFPDAPTERGVKHVEELMHCISEGYDAFLFFVIQRKGITSFSPHRERHPEFADVLLRAQNAGVKILAFDCLVTENTMLIDGEIPVIL